ALPGGAFRSAARASADWRGDRRRRSRSAWPCDVCARRYRLGRRDQGVLRGAHQLLAGWSDRHGSQFALRRARNHGIENIFAPYRVAELDFSASQCGGRRRRLAPLRKWPEGAFRYDEGLANSEWFYSLLPIRYSPAKEDGD